MDLESGLVTGVERAQVADAAQRLVQDGADEADVGGAARHFRATHFAGQRGDRPTPSQLVKAYRDWKHTSPGDLYATDHQPQPHRVPARVANDSAALQRFLARKGVELRPG